MKSLVPAILFLSANHALAGCANYTDGSLGNAPAPRYLVCYDDVCNETELTYQCSNLNSIQTGYSIGWTVNCQLLDSGKQECTILWKGRPIDPSKHHRLRFEELNE
jgi:hypothetical protein